MSQPVKLSDSLVVDARVAGKISERSIAGQVEFWARLGRAVELVLRGDHVLALSRSAATVSLASALADVDTDGGRKRVRRVLDSLPFPHYEAWPDDPRLLVRIEADGRRTVGRFVGREFVQVRRKTSKG